MQQEVRVKIRNATDLSTDDFTLKLLKEWVTLTETNPQVNSHSYITNVTIKVKEVQILIIHQKLNRYINSIFQRGTMM